MFKRARIKVDQPGIGGKDAKEADYLSNFGPGYSTFL